MHVLTIIINHYYIAYIIFVFQAMQSVIRLGLDSLQKEVSRTGMQNVIK